MNGLIDVFNDGGFRVRSLGVLMVVKFMADDGNSSHRDSSAWLTFGH